MNEASQGSQELTVSLVTDPIEWNALIAQLAGHPLQNWDWAELKSASGHWSATRVAITDVSGAAVGAAQILTRRLPWPMRSLHYVPRGPALVPEISPVSAQLALSNWVRSHLGGIALRLEPQWPKPDTEAEFRALTPGKIARDTVLHDHTLILDLHLTEAELLANMAKKTRQYIRKSQREALVYREVESESELRSCLDIYEETARRAGFALHQRDYYQRAWHTLAGNSKVFAAFDGDAPVAFLWLAANNHVAFELWGGVNDRGQELRANYALKWHAIEQYRALGVAEYDLNGLLNDGISTFKRGFASHETPLIGTLDLPFNGWYRVWEVAIPRVKALLRRVRG